jgi:PAS domain S-box-containing protein
LFNSKALNTRYPDILNKVQTALFRHLHHSFLVLDKQERVLELSSRNSAFFLVDRAVPGLSLEEVLHPVWVKTVRNLIPLVNEDQPIHSSRVLDFEQGGRIHYGETELMGLDNPDLILVLFKIRTEVAEAEQERERKIKALVENAMDAIFIADEGGNVKYVSPNIEQLLGYTEEEAGRLNMFDVLHPDDHEGVGAKWMQLLQHPSAPIRGDQARVKHKDGSWRWIEANFDNRLNDSTLHGIVGNIRDITDRILKEERIARDQEELIRTNQMLVEAQEIAQLGYWEVNLVTREVYWTEECYNIWMPGKKIKPTLEYFYSTIHPDDRAAFEEINERSLATGQPLDAVHRILLPDNTIKWVHERASVIKDETGKNIILKGTTQDITESRQNLEALRASNERFELVNKATSDAIWDYDVIKDTLYWGDGFNTLFGYTSPNEPNDPSRWRENIHPEDRAEIMHRVTVALEDPTVNTWTSEYRFRKADNSYAYVLDKVFMIRDRNGKALRMLGALQDITELKEAERKLALFKNVLDTTRDGVAIYTPATKRCYLNQAMQQILQCSEEDISALESPALLLSDLTFGNEIMRTLMEGNYFSGDIQVRARDGSLIDLQMSAGPIFDEFGQVESVYAIHMDISQRKQYLNEILRVKQNLDTLINNTGDMVWSFDTHLRLIVGNHAFAQYYESVCGFEPSEGNSVLPPGISRYVRDQWEPLYRRALVGEAFTQEIELENEQNDGRQHLFLSFTPMRNDAFEVVGAACFARDISELKRASVKLEELNHELLVKAEELAASNADLERFAFIASHDLQEPLRMVSSFLQLLKQRYHGQLDAKADSYIDFAVDGATRMKNLINDLLNYARIGNSGVDAVPIDLNQVVRDVQILLKTKMEENNAMVVSEPLPVIRQGNYTQLLQLFQNLVGNAIKYRSSADPLVQIGVEDTGTAWTIFVRDNGIGLDMRYADKIFMVFQRLHAQKSYNGTGIGLSICKRIIEKMGGKIWVESEPGCGSCFYFTIVK